MKILKLSFYPFILLFFILLFLPKENIYYFVEKKLFENKIILNEKNIKEGLFGLNVDDIDIFYDSTNIMKAEKLNLFFTIFYNRVMIKDIRAQKSFQNFMSEKIDTISLRHAIFYPTKVWINIRGEFGQINGNYNIKNKNVHLELKPQENFEKKYPFLRINFKDIEGKLIYESINK